MKWLGVLVVLGLAGRAEAQSMEPRFYSNAPKGMNFLLGGYVYSHGGVAFDPALELDDANMNIHSPVVAYARSLDFFGKSAKFDVVVPYSYLSGTATQNGNPVSREVDGFNDPQFRASVNFIGAPALSLKEFMAYQQNFVMGASLKMTAPLGQYDNSKLVNIGQNRWSITPELGMSKTLGPLILEVAGSVSFFSNNDDAFGMTLEQDPIYAVQGHLVYTLPKAIWIALDATYYAGGETTVGGVEKDNTLGNSRLGATLALPVNKKNSLKLYFSEGISKRTGSDFTIAGVAWQYRWGGGL
ncbi:transporter [Pontiellaceae bacterium B12227]|nr:transporter [Pontiellaceae bacterium B12227]